MLSEQLISSNVECFWFLVFFIENEKSRARNSQGFLFSLFHQRISLASRSLSFPSVVKPQLSNRHADNV